MTIVNTSTAFLTDFYELTMLQAAMEDGTAEKKAVFELFARKLPAGRRYGIVAGTGRAIQAVKDYRFTPEQISWLRDNTDLNDITLDYLNTFEFKGTITGLPEGTPYFNYSPIMTVSGTFAECVLMETVLLSIFNHDSAVASAAARMVQAADNDEKHVPIIEMGSRRTNERSAPAAARASYIAGFDATSNIEAGYLYGIPVTGTAAHAFTLAYGDETKAFEAQTRSLGKDTTLLVDTYNIENGINTAIKVAGNELGGVRIDSGDLYEETMKARKQLDAAGNTDTKIVLSSDIDEFVIAELMERGIPVDGVGAGTRVVTGSGAPTAGMVYKLVSIEDREAKNGMRQVSKKSKNKVSVGGSKAIFRDYENKMEFIVCDDTIADMRLVHTVHLTELFIEKGTVVFRDTVEKARERHREAMAKLSKDDKSVQAGGVAFRTEYLGSDVTL